MGREREKRTRRLRKLQILGVLKLVWVFFNGQQLSCYVYCSTSLVGWPSSCREMFWKKGVQNNTKNTTKPKHNPLKQQKSPTFLNTIYSIFFCNYAGIQQDNRKIFWANEKFWYHNLNVQLLKYMCCLLS